jgi:hypothetical protein
LQGDSTTTRSNASRARRRGHGDGDFAAVHDIELHSGITSNTREAQMLRGCGGKLGCEELRCIGLGMLQPKWREGWCCPLDCAKQGAARERSCRGCSSRGGAEGGAAAPWMGEARPRISNPGEQSMPHREQRRAPWLPAAESRGKNGAGRGADVEGKLQGVAPWGGPCAGVLRRSKEPSGGRRPWHSRSNPRLQHQPADHHGGSSRPKMGRRP